MMKNTNEEKKQSSSINNKIRSCGFVPYKTSNLESFKSSKAYAILRKFVPKFYNLKRTMNTIIEKPKLWFSFVRWDLVKEDLFPWIFDVIIEGLILNWATHKLFGIEFSLGMVIAHGALIKEILSIHKRIKKDGQPTKLLTKN